jgi:hypothetical protein
MTGQPQCLVICRRFFRGNRSSEGPRSTDADADRDMSVEGSHTLNTVEQGEAANIKQNTTNKGFFQGGS